MSFQRLLQFFLRAPFRGSPGRSATVGGRDRAPERGEWFGETRARPRARAGGFFPILPFTSAGSFRPLHRSGWVFCVEIREHPCGGRRRDRSAGGEVALGGVRCPRNREVVRRGTADRRAGRGASCRIPYRVRTLCA